MRASTARWKSGGDSYETARRGQEYVQRIQARFERNPLVNPANVK